MTPFVVWEVAFVPPFAIGSAVPEYDMASVPVVVMGEPVMERKDGTEAATEVTPVFAMRPVALLYEMPVPAESEVEEILSLKVVQFVEVRYPFVEPFAAAIVSGDPAVPFPVMGAFTDTKESPPRPVADRQVPLIEKHPFVRFKPFAKVEEAVVEVV